MEVQPRVSTEGRLLTIAFFLAILRVPIINSTNEDGQTTQKLNLKYKSFKEIARLFRIRKLHMNMWSPAGCVFMLGIN